MLEPCRGGKAQNTHTAPVCTSPGRVGGKTSRWIDISLSDQGPTVFLTPVLHWRGLVLMHFFSSVGR